jgi:hypothetical protein
VKKTLFLVFCVVTLSSFVGGYTGHKTCAGMSYIAIRESETSRMAYKHKCTSITGKTAWWHDPEEFALLKSVFT